MWVRFSPLDQPHPQGASTRHPSPFPTCPPRLSFLDGAQVSPLLGSPPGSPGRGRKPPFVSPCHLRNWLGVPIACGIQSSFPATWDPPGISVVRGLGHRLVSVCGLAREPQQACVAICHLVRGRAECTQHSLYRA